MLLPLLSEADPAYSTESMLDPLGLYAIGDSLGVKLVPGVRERQSHPRYLTAMAVGAVVCAQFDHKTFAADGASAPWQVFEWYMVEGLVRTQEQGKEIVGLPGRDKANQAIQDRRPLSARNYLKTPNVFGFHGVYRLLARTLDVVDDVAGLGETGYRLATAWEREHDLQGFVTSATNKEKSKANDLYHKLTSAVKDGLDKGAISRSGQWDGWQFFNNYLHPGQFSAQEQSVISGALSSHMSPLRQEIISFLVSAEGQAQWKLEQSERAFHQWIHAKGSPELKFILEAIKAYEMFSRLLQDAFTDCLKLMTDKRGKIHLKELAQLPCVERAAIQIPETFYKTSELLQPFKESIRFEQNFGSFAAKMNVDEWLNNLFDHHKKIQIAKLPNGRATWLERFDDGSAIIHPMYFRDKGGQFDDEYMHAYRTRPLWSFLTDLGLVAG